MRSIGLRLALSFAAVILVGVGGAAVLAGRETTSEFRTYVERGRALFVEHMAGSAAQYYRGRGTWEGLADFGFHSQVAGRLLVVPAGFVSDLASVPRVPGVWFRAAFDP